MKIAVIGTGYVGLVTGTCLAEFGHHVTCLDVDTAKIAMLRKGTIPIYEPDLEIYIQRNVSRKRLAFATDRKKAVAEADVVVLALPTPQNEDGSTDVSYILQEAERLAPFLKNDAVVVNKSTVPAGTAERVEGIVNGVRKTPVEVVSNPEFLREGMAVQDFFYPDRVVIGAKTARAKKIMKKLYEPLERNSVPILFMDRASAEIAKYAANSFLATKISFMNEIANLCEKLGADVDAVREAVGADTRIGHKFLYPGIGYGGSCFPKDLIGLVRTAEQQGLGMGIVEAAIAANKHQQEILVEKVVQYFKGDIHGKHFALWGLAFKPNTDDIREASAKAIIARLIELGATVAGYDPQANANMAEVFSKSTDFQTHDDMYDVLKNADALLIATEWQQFYSPDFERMKQLLKAPLIFDGRNLYSENDMHKAGEFRYESIGRKVTQP